MTGVALLAVALLLACAGCFGACLPVVRELGRPSRFASAMLCGAILVTAATAIFQFAGFARSLPALFIPLVTASVVAGWLLCRLPDSPGPENAYPGFPVALVVGGATLYVVAMLSSGGAPPLEAAPQRTSASVLTLLHDLPFSANAAASGGPARLLPILWMLAGLPLVAALLAMHLPLRRGWMVAATWYAAMSLSLAHWLDGGGRGALWAVFVTLGALAAFSCGKERRLVPFGTMMLFGAAITGSDDLLVVAAIVAGAVLREIVATLPGTRHRVVALLPLLAPLVALAIALTPDLPLLPADTAREGWIAVSDVARGALSTIILATGLALGNLSRNAHHPAHRALQAR